MRFNPSQRGSLLAAAAFLAICVVVLQARIDPLRRQPAIESASIGKTGGPIGESGAALPFEYTLGALSGFRQVIAGLLWVRSDSFFHSGNYDAILPCIRLITWLDPNWLDPYATGAWHLMYNFTDTDQRSDRRYLPAGLSLLKEGIANNSKQYDMYKEAGWNNYDKIKNYPEAAKYYAAGMENDPKGFDITQIEHALAHSYEKSGDVDKAIATWDDAVKRHKAILDDPKASQDEKARNQSGYENAKRNLFITRVRQYHRTKQTQPPVDVQFSAQVIRVRPRVLEISGQWNLVGSKLYDATDANKPNEFGKGVLIAGPVDGARVDVRLQDQGYKMPDSSEFNFDIDSNLTIMQDALSTRGGKRVNVGGLYAWSKAEGGSLPRNQTEQGIYSFNPKDGTDPGVPIAKALAGGATISAEGQRQLEAITQEPLAQLRTDSAKLAELTKQGIGVAKENRYILGKFKREIDMSKDPKMYGFKKDKYDLILSINPAGAPDFVQDRIGLLGEGWTDKRYLDTTTVPGVRMIRQVITLTKEDIEGKERKALFPPVTIKTASK